MGTPLAQLGNPQQIILYHMLLVFWYTKNLSQTICSDQYFTNTVEFGNIEPISTWVQDNSTSPTAWNSRGMVRVPEAVGGPAHVTIGGCIL